MENVQNKQPENQVAVKAPAGLLVNMYMSRFGKIFSNLAIVSILFVLISFLTPIVSLLYYVVLFIVMCCSVVFTIGTVFAFAPDFVPSILDKIENGSDLFGKIIDFLNVANPYILGVCAGLSVLSILLLSLNKHDKSVWRIVVSSILVVVSVIGLLMLISGGNA